MPNDFNIGKQIGELHTIVSATQKTVEALDGKLDTSIAVIEKKIDNHTNVDHVKNVKYMNWMATAKHFSPHALLAIVICLCYLFLPEPVLGLLIKIKSGIGGLL